MQRPELELIIETIPDAVTIIDSSGSIIYANRAAEIIFGLNRSEVKKRAYNAQSWKITTPEGRPFPEEELPFNRVVKSKKPVYGIVHAIEKPDSTRIMLTVNAAPILNENGEVKSVVITFADITEQRNAADEIRESRKQVLDILESITDAFYALDNDWRFTYVNHRAEELFGIRREQLLFRNIWQVIRKEQSPEIYEKYHQAKEQITPVILEYYSPRLKKWLEMHVFPYQNGISVYIRDITDRKRAEEERIANLHFFVSMERVNRAILVSENLEQMMSDVLDELLSIFDCDRAWLLYPCDPEAKAYRIPMEKTKPEYPGALSSGIEVPIDVPAAETMRLVLRSGEPVQFGAGSNYSLPPLLEKRYDVKSQLSVAIYPKLERVKPWEFGMHQCSYPRVWTSDEKRLFNEIGRRLADGLTSLLAQQKLQKSEQKYRELFEESFDGIFVTTPKGKVIDANKKAVEIFGYDTKEEVFCLDLVRDVYADPKDREKILEVIDRQGTGEFDIAMKKKGGDKIIAHILTSAVKDENGEIISYRGLVYDATEQKKAEENIKQQLEELQRSQNVLLEKEKQNRELKQKVNQLMSIIREASR